MSPSHHQEVLRRIPGVDEILAAPQIAPLLSLHPRPVVVDAIRKGLGRLRKNILKKEGASEAGEGPFSMESLLPLFHLEIDRQVRPRLRPVINATGVVVHTNLGRSPLPPSALQRMLDISRGYSNLEFDLLRGERGSRHSHVDEILCRLSGAESALVVNNNAGAVLLTLNTLAEGREVVVSRGELVEIGGAFRIPDVMKRSGALLKEVGTTNRTYLSDYEEAIGPQTALLLKVHTSNFRVMGFSSEASHPDLVDLGKRYHLPVMDDLGSGCFVDLSRYGIEKEPTVQEAIKAGLDIVTFSGDKLLGGPQAGIILGRKHFLDLIKVNPMTRAVRIDKLTLAALESTLLLYLDEERAIEEIPTLRMLCADLGKLKRRGNRLLRRISGVVKEKMTLTLREDVSQVGGGALPLQELPTIVLAANPFNFSLNRLEQNLRKGDPPVISRIHKDELLFDMRTVFDHEVPLLARGLEAALTRGRESDAEQKE